MKTIEMHAQDQFDAAEQKFLEDPDKLNKIMAWYFNELFAVKQGMTELMPKKWKIFRTYTDIYHSLMHNWLIKRIDDPELSPPHMLSIIDWVEKYYQKMAKLSWSQADLQLPVLDLSPNANPTPLTQMNMAISAQRPWETCGACFGNSFS